MGRYGERWGKKNKENVDRATFLTSSILRLVPIQLLRHNLGWRDVLPLRPHPRRAKDPGPAQRDWQDRQLGPRHLLSHHLCRLFPFAAIRQLARRLGLHPPTAQSHRLVSQPHRGHQAGSPDGLDPRPPWILAFHVSRTVCDQLQVCHRPRGVVRPVSKPINGALPPPAFILPFLRLSS